MIDEVEKVELKRNHDFTKIILILAVLLFSSGFKLAAQTPEALIGQGLQAEGVDAKEALFMRALAIDPGNFVAMNNVAMCHELRHDYAKAVEWYAKAIETAREKKQAFYEPWFGLGDVYAATGEFRKAWVAWNRGLAGRPDDTETLARLAEIKSRFPDYFDSSGEFLFQDSDQIVEALLPKRGISVKPRAQLIIEFDYNSDRIKSSSLPQIENLARALQSEHFSATRFIIGGHTDSRGSPEYNKALSTRRAKAVFDCLTEKFGLVADRFEIMGFGKEQLIILEEKSEDDYQRNRRVEVMPK